VSFLAVSTHVCVHMCAKCFCDVCLYLREWLRDSDKCVLGRAACRVGVGVSVSVPVPVSLSAHAVLSIESCLLSLVY